MEKVLYSDEIIKFLSENNVKDTQESHLEVGNIYAVKWNDKPALLTIIGKSYAGGYENLYTVNIESK